MLCKDFLPLIDNHSKKFREELQSLEKGLDAVITTQKEQFAEVFQFVQDTALLWDGQKTSIDQLRKKYQVQHFAISFVASNLSQSLCCEQSFIGKNV